MTLPDPGSLTEVGDVLAAGAKNYADLDALAAKWLRDVLDLHPLA